MQLLRTGRISCEWLAAPLAAAQPASLAASRRCAHAVQWRAVWRAQGSKVWGCAEGWGWCWEQSSSSQGYRPRFMLTPSRNYAVKYCATSAEHCHQHVAVALARCCPALLSEAILQKKPWSECCFSSLSPKYLFLVFFFFFFVVMPCLNLPILCRCIVSSKLKGRASVPYTWEMK